MAPRSITTAVSAGTATTTLIGLPELWDEGIVAALAADMVADHPVINASTEPVGER